MVSAILVPVAAQINVWVGVSTAIVCFAPLRAIARPDANDRTGAQQRRAVLFVA